MTLQTWRLKKQFMGTLYYIEAPIYYELLIRYYSLIARCKNF